MKEQLRLIALALLTSIILLGTMVVIVTSIVWTCR